MSKEKKADGGEEEMKTFKIILLGNSTVGKTSFILRFCENKFDSESIATIGIDTKTKFLKKDNQKIQLQIWDTAGQERFRSITKNSIKGADGILLIYDISNKISFTSLKKWISDLKENVDIAKVGIVVVGNKCDVDASEREVDEDMKQKLKEQTKVTIIEASAKNDINVKESFLALIDELNKLGLGKKTKGKDEDDDDDPNNKSIKLNKNTKDKNNVGGNCPCKKSK